MPRQYTISEAVMQQRRDASKKDRTATKAVIDKLAKARAKRWPKRKVRDIRTGRFISQKQ